MRRDRGPERRRAARVIDVEVGERDPGEVVRRQPDGSWKFLYDDPYGRG